MSVTNTGISWTNATWNPVRGCSLVSPGCTHCYAMKTAHRLGKNPILKGGYEGLTKATSRGPVWAGEVRLVPDALTEPLHWRSPRRVFVNSMSDLFHPKVPDGFILRVFLTMAKARQHTFQILTKRPERMRDWFRRWADLSGESPEPQLARGPEATRKAHPSGRGQMFASMLETMGEPPPGFTWPTFDWAEGLRWKWSETMVLPNVWLGVSVENRKAISRIRELKRIPAYVRFLSLEPLLEDLGEIPLEGISWVIAGGESGPRHRPMAPAWARSIKEQCQAAGVAFFFKQGSAFRAGRNPWITEPDGSRWKWEQFPGDLTPPERVEEVFHA